MMWVRERGFTVLEVAVVVGIIGVLATISMATFSSMQYRNALRIATEDVLLTLRSARTQTLASRNDTVYGVRIESSRITRFTGSTYTASSSANLVQNFAGSVQASLSLSASTSNIVFARLTGEASATGTILLTDTRSGATSSVSIEKTGLITVVQ